MTRASRIGTGSPFFTKHDVKLQSIRILVSSTYGPVQVLKVSCGKELALKHGLNIICILHALGPRVDVSAMPDIVATNDVVAPGGRLCCCYC